MFCKKKSFWQRFTCTETTGEEDEEVDDSELNLDKVEEEMAADYSDEEEEEILHIDDLQAAMPGIWILLRNISFSKCKTNLVDI